MTFHVPEKYRIKTGLMGSDKSYGNNGQFYDYQSEIKTGFILPASDGFGWNNQHYQRS